MLGVSDSSWGPASLRALPPSLPPSHLGTLQHLPAPPAVVPTLTSPALRGEKGLCLLGTLPMPDFILSHSTQKLGLSGWAVQGVTGSSPRCGAQCSPVAVGGRCCCGLGVPVGSVAPLQGGENGQGAAPPWGGRGAGCSVALHRVVWSPQGAGASATGPASASLPFPRGFHKH